MLGLTVSVDFDDRQKSTRYFPPVDLVVRLFGGVRAVARAVQCDPSAVVQWKKSGVIPSRRHAKILRYAWDNGIDLTAHDLIFGAYRYD